MAIHTVLEGISTDVWTLESCEKLTIPFAKREREREHEREKERQTDRQTDRQTERGLFLEGHDLWGLGHGH